MRAALHSSSPCLQGEVGRGCEARQRRTLLQLTSPLPNPTAIGHNPMAFVTTRAMARKRRASPLHSQGREQSVTAQLLP